MQEGKQFIEPTAFGAAEAYFNECAHLHQYLIERVRPRVQQVATGRTEPFYEMLLRTISWLRTLSKLKEPSDFQGVVAANRTVFEIAVDATLMHFDERSYPPAMLLAREDSAKLKAALKVREFYSGKPVPHGHTPLIQFIERDTKRVEALRVKYWPGKKGTGHHPSRWTGHDLEHDARAATKLFPDGEFDEFYATQYSRLCWNTHGSGLAGARGLSEEDFPVISALAFRWSAEFAEIVAKLVLQHFKLWDAAVGREFEEHRIARMVTTDAAMTENRAASPVPPPGPP